MNNPLTNDQCKELSKAKTEAIRLAILDTKSLGNACFSDSLLSRGFQIVATPEIREKLTSTPDQATKLRKMVEDSEKE